MAGYICIFEIKCKMCIEISFKLIVKGGKQNYFLTNLILKSARLKLNV